PGRAAGENVGDYAINLGTLASTNANYVLALSGTTVNFHISPATVTVTPNSGQSKVYGTNDPTLTSTLSTAVTVSGALGRAAGENVGDYAINLGTLASTNANYVLALSGTTVNFHISPASSTTTVTGGTFVYDGSAHAATVTVTGPGGLNLTMLTP